MTYDLLDKIDSPKDLKKLSLDQLELLCSQLRDYMVRCCAVNPGHLGSSLGAVEIIVGLHYVFNSPKDKLVFDVGHQAYAHKILTGRREAFKGNRTREGISGFPQIAESPYDAFGTGHSSTSISAGLGLAQAAKMRGSDEKVAVLIGDGAMTGGLAFEGLNNAGDSKTDILVILNDNNQSIDKNIGAMHEALLKLTTDQTYNKVKSHLWDFLGEGKLRHKVQNMTKNAKTNIVRATGGSIFEALGFRYFGPIDGNDIKTVVDTLGRLKDMKGPRLLHILTKKGKGFAPAEADPTTWHAPGRFNPETGERILGDRHADRYQDVFGQTLSDLAALDSKVVGVTPAMSTGCGMTVFEKAYPERFFDVGIEEEHAVTFSAGLAEGGMKPFCNIYSSFSQRAYDQIIHDVALQNLPVVLCFDRGGLVGEDGATHHGVFDLAAYRSIPNAIISAPRDELELRNLMYTGLFTEGGPYIIRYPRGCGEGRAWKDTEFTKFEVGKGEKLRRGSGLAILALGPEACRAMEAATLLKEKGSGDPAVFDMRYLKPLDEEILKEAAKYGRILTVEEGSLKGGLFGAVTEYMASHDVLVRIHGLGVPDRFIRQDRQSSQRAECGLDAEGIAKAAEALLKLPV